MAKVLKFLKKKYILKQSGEMKNLYCCSQCAKDAQKPKYDDIKMEFEKRGYVLCDSKYTNAKTKLKYICKHHPEYGVQYMSVSNAYKQHCPIVIL